MARFLTAWVLSGVALAAAAGLLGDKMNIGGAGDTLGQELVALVVIALIFAIVNLVVAPVVRLLSLPLIILTLGLALLIINALLLLLTEAIARGLDVDFHVESFGWAIVASIVISVVNAVLGTYRRD